MMLHHLAEKRFDLIITKNLSRLNRSTHNNLKFTILRRAYNVSLYTIEDDKIHDFDEDFSRFSLFEALEGYMPFQDGSHQS